MKRTSLLNRQLSSLIASLGHKEEIVIGDAGLPIPKGVDVIDLAVSAGTPGFFDLLSAVQSELAVEEAVFAEEASDIFQTSLKRDLHAWEEDQGQKMEISTVSHTAFKERMLQAKAVIRTGETTPYANVILVSGVVF